MQKWNKHFYQSKAWRDCRESYLILQNYICERCGEIAKIVHHKTYLTPKNISCPYLTLGHDNLEALCQDCHNAEHHGKPKAYRYVFDEWGNVLRPPTCNRST